MAEPAVAPAPAPSPAPGAPPSPAPAARSPSPASPARVDQATYDRMSIGERYQYARQFPQGADALPPDPPAPDPVAPKPGEPPAPVGEKVKVGQYETSESEIAGGTPTWAASRSALNLSRSQDYIIKTPADWRAIDGVEFQVDANSPAFSDLKNWAHKNSIPQGEVETLVGLYASYESHSSPKSCLLLVLEAR
jgi:hypothetical protein